MTGDARYIDDLPELPGTLQIYVAQSALAAADIPGVNDASPAFGDDPVFAEDIVEYAGQSLFAVAAGTLEQAREASRPACVEVEKLPAEIAASGAAGFLVRRQAQAEGTRAGHRAAARGG